MDLNLVKTFVKLAQTGSFTQAAKALGQPKSRVSRAISRLERELSTQLVRRTTRQTSLTDEGEKFFQATHRIISNLEQEIDSVLESGDELSGTIRITAPEDLAQAYLPSLLARYAREHPRVDIQTMITNEYVDLVKHNVDLAFRIGILKDSNLIQKKLQKVSLILVATPEYLKTWGTPQRLEDLVDHVFLPFHTWKQIPELVKLELEPKMMGDSFVFLVNMALQHIGITMLPDFYAKTYIQKGELVHLISSFEGNPNQLNLLYPTRKTSARVRSLIKMVSD